MKKELQRIKRALQDRKYLVTRHAEEEAVEEEISEKDIQEAVSSGKIIENYPKHRRGSCCLIYGDTRKGRPIHIVCTTQRPITLITAYEPKPPKWITPTKKGGKV